MTAPPTIKARRLPDGALVQELPDGTTRPLMDRTDWARLRAMSEEEMETNAESDPDNPPLTEAELAALPRTPRAAIIRRALRLTREDFAARYGIPVETLRDWEEGRSIPDPPAWAYLMVIAADPEGVGRLLERAVG